jgi:predicted DNA-binding protein
MVSLKLDTKTERKLTRLSRQAGVSPEVCVEHAVAEYLDDLATVVKAQKRSRRNEKIYSSEEAKRVLGL